MTKLPDTSETTIAIIFLVINFSALLRQILRFFYLFRKKRLFFCSLIVLAQLMLCSNKSFNPYVLLALNS